MVPQLSGFAYSHGTKNLTKSPKVAVRTGVALTRSFKVRERERERERERLHVASLK